MLILILGVLAILRTPVDIFPTVDIPVIAVVWTFNGMQPKEMEQRLVSSSERAYTTTVNDIEHMESESYNGVAVIKIFFHPAPIFPPTSTTLRANNVTVAGP